MPRSAKKENNNDWQVQDIMQLDAKIKEELENNRNNIILLQSRAKELEELLNKRDKLSNVKIRIYQQELSNTKIQIDKLQNDYLLTEYEFMTDSIMQKYVNIMQIPKQIHFSRPLVTKSNSNSQKQNLHQQYLTVAKNYLNIDNFAENDAADVQVCICGTDYNHIVDENNIICSNCGTEFDLMTNTTSWKDLSRINMSSKFKYERESHFRDAVQQYQGKQNKRIDSKVYQDLHDAFAKHNMLSIGNTPEEVYRKVTKKHIAMFLSETHHNKHYENLSLIASHFGHTCPDIGKLERLLMEDFRKILFTFETIGNVNRKNFLNNQYVLYQLLRRRKFPCKKEDFNIIDSVDRLREHDELMARICEKLQWNFTPVL